MHCCVVKKRAYTHIHVYHCTHTNPVRAIMHIENNINFTYLFYVYATTEEHLAIIIKFYIKHMARQPGMLCTIPV